MTDKIETDNEDEDDMLAAELALRLLEGDELAEAERRRREDPAFRSAVEGWAMRLAGMAEAEPEERPSPRSKQALMTRLFPQAAPQRPALWSRVGLWRGISLASIVLAAGLAWVLLTGPTRQTGPLYTAAIATETGDFRVVAVVDKTANEITLTRTAGSPPAGRILQVWAHGPGAPATSVGLWPEGDVVRLGLPPEIAAVEGVLTVGVSEEPPGGSPTGSPSGRVFGTVDIPGVRSGT